MEKKKIWLMVIFAVLVYLAMVIYADFGKLINAISNFTWYLIFGVLGLTMVNYIIRFLKWEYFLKKVKVDLAIKDSLFIFFSGLAMIITPGKIGEIWKGWLVKDLNGEELSRTIPVVIAERMTDVVGLILLSIVGVIYYYEEGIYLLGVIFLLLIGFFFVIKSKFVTEKIYSFVEKRTEEYSENIKTLHDSFDTLMRPKGIVSMSIVSALAWFFECVGLYLVLIGFGDSISMTKATFIFSFSSLAGAVSMIPGGLGVAEGSISALLKLFGSSSSVAVGSSMIIRFGTLWFGALLGAITYIGFRNKIFGDKKTKKEKRIKDREKDV